MGWAALKRCGSVLRELFRLLSFGAATGAPSGYEPGRAKNPRSCLPACCWGRLGLACQEESLAAQLIAGFAGIGASPVLTERFAGCVGDVSGAGGNEKTREGVSLAGVFGCASGSGFALVKLCAYAFSYRQSAPVVHQNSFALRSGAGLVKRTTVTGYFTTRSTTHSLAEQKTGGCCAWPGSPSHQPPDFYAVFRGTYPSSRVVSSCANANECATLPQYFAVCKDYLHLFFNIVRPSLISDISPSRLTASRLAILMGSCLKT